MKVLWVVNIPFGPMMELAGLRGDNAGGSWLNAALSELADSHDVEICVATSWKGSKFRYVVQGNVSYCVLPGGVPGRYRMRSAARNKLWETLREHFSPDVIHVWGTEYKHGYHAMQVMSDIPSVIYIQGLLDSIARYYISGLTRAEQIYCRGLLDLLSVNPVEKARRSYERRAFDETKMIRQSKNVIVENNWCAAHCLAVESKCRVFRSKLPIREEFFRARWVPEQVMPHTIMCNTSGYPIKGLHILLRALSLIVQEFPDAVLKIPGISFLPRQGFLGRFRGQGYARLIKRLIDVLGLQKNVKFLGLIPTSEGVASEMASSDVFVMPSSIENHSSTLIEAMIVGVPCVASDVGGVGELIEHGETGFIYRFEEYELLAQHVCRLFREQSLACRIGTRAREVMRTQRASGGVKDEFLSIYRSILESERGGHT